MYVACYMAAMYAVARAQSLRSQAIEQIRKAIVAGTLKPGSMHSEQSIAVAMAISRTPIREALLQLSGEGLVEFIPQRGVRITEVDPAHLVQVFEFRAAIEGHCAAQLARKPNPEVLAELEAELDRQRALIRKDDRLAWVQANMDFHTKLVAGSNNRLMLETLAPLASHTMRIGYRMNYRRQRMEESVDEHSAVVDAIRRRDADRARELASEHLYITTVLMKQMVNDLYEPGNDNRDAN
jgi:DNA-binding GntR family transcriptional regulator